MKVILTQDIAELGKAGQLVNVSEGHGRNFLIPRKMAVMADSGAMKNLETRKQAVKAKSDKMLIDANSLAERISKLKVIIKGKSGAGTRLYGSITSQEIADALKAQHKIVVDKRKISISEPIKTTGMFEVPVKLHQEVSTIIHVEVIGQE